MLLFITIPLAKGVLGKGLAVPFHRKTPLRKNMHVPKKLDSPSY